MTTLKFKSSGDTQLWVAEGDGWSIPVYAHPYTDAKGNVYFKVTAAMAVNHHQFEALDRKMAQMSIAPYDDAWCVAKSDMEEQCHKAEGITPAFYFKWNRQSMPQKATELVVEKGKVKNEPMNDAFLKYVNSRFKLTDRTSQLRYIWFILCTEMASWVYNKQGTVDLGFAKLDAVPFRRNWKQVLLSKFPKFMGLIRRFKKKPAFMANLALTDFPIEMRRGDMMELTGGRDSTLMWSLELTPTESWKEFINEQERDLLAKNGQTTYVAFWKKRVDRAETRAIEIFREFVEATSRPCATVRSSGKTGARRLVPLIPKGKVIGVSMDRGAGAVVTEDPDSPKRSNERPEVVEDEGESLPEMSVIRFEPKELRNAGNLSRN